MTASSSKSKQKTAASESGYMRGMPRTLVATRMSSLKEATTTAQQTQQQLQQNSVELLSSA